jgi:hypothetical protein
MNDNGAAAIWCFFSTFVTDEFSGTGVGVGVGGLSCGVGFDVMAPFYFLVFLFPVDICHYCILWLQPVKESYLLLIAFMRFGALTSNSLSSCWINFLHIALSTAPP